VEIKRVFAGAMFRRVRHSASSEDTVQQERHCSCTVFRSITRSQW